MLVQSADDSTDTSARLQQFGRLAANSPSLYVLRSVRTAVPNHQLYAHLRPCLRGFHTKAYREELSRSLDLLLNPTSSQQQHLSSHTISLAPQQHHAICCGLVEGRCHLYRLHDAAFSFMPASLMSPNASYVDVMLLCYMVDSLSFIAHLREFHVCKYTMSDQPIDSVCNLQNTLLRRCTLG